MAYFKREKHTDEMGKKWWIYNPTIKKTGENIVQVKGRNSDQVFVKRRRK